MLLIVTKNASKFQFWGVQSLKMHFFLFKFWSLTSKNVSKFVNFFSIFFLRGLTIFFAKILGETPLKRIREKNKNFRAVVIVLNSLAFISRKDFVNKRNFGGVIQSSHCDKDRSGWVVIKKITVKVYYKFIFLLEYFVRPGKKIFLFLIKIFSKFGEVGNQKNKKLADFLWIFMFSRIFTTNSRSNLFHFGSGFDEKQESFFPGLTINI